MIHLIHLNSIYTHDARIRAPAHTRARADPRRRNSSEFSWIRWINGNLQGSVWLNRRIQLDQVDQQVDQREFAGFQLARRRRDPPESTWEPLKATMFHLRAVAPGAARAPPGYARPAHGGGEAPRLTPPHQRLKAWLSAPERVLHRPSLSARVMGHVGGSRGQRPHWCPHGGLAAPSGGVTMPMRRKALLGPPWREETRPRGQATDVVARYKARVMGSAMGLMD